MSKRDGRREAAETARRMRIIRNTGTERVIDLLRPGLRQAHQLDLVTEALSLFAFEELGDEPGLRRGWHLESPSLQLRRQRQ